MNSKLSLVLCSLLLTLTGCTGAVTSSSTSTSSVASIALSSASSRQAMTQSSSVASSQAVVVVPSSSSSSLKSSSSSTSSSNSSNSSISSNSSSSAATVASNGVPYCTPAGTDPDGDGWGWENNASCIVRNSVVDPDKGSFKGCIVGTASVNFCNTDNGSWGFENGVPCMSYSFCPANKVANTGPVSTTLVNKASSAATQAVYNYLRSIWGKKILSGQQDLTWNDGVDMLQRVQKDTNKQPAIMGYDFMNYATYTSGGGLAQTEEAINYWSKGGLVTLAWHWRDPSRSTQEFYSKSSGRSPFTNYLIPIKNGVLDTTHSSFANLNQDLDVIADQLKKLQDAGVPVLWRPLHEAAGGWFWWGAPRTDGIAPAYANVVLWRYIYDRFVNVKKLNNLIWVWNGQGAAWYPGDAYVDIASTDVYDGQKNYISQLDIFNKTANFPGHAMMVAMSENSNIPDPDAIQADGAWWLYFIVWNDGSAGEGVTDSNNYWTGEYYNTKAHRQKVYNHNLVITLDELPKF